VTTFLTGATGFLGRHLVRLIAERGDRLRALVREGTDDSFLRSYGVEVVRGSLLDVDAARKAVAGCELVFHLAGVVSHERRDLGRLLAANVDGVRAVLEAVDPSARLVHVSSVAALGPASSRSSLVDERQPFPPEADRLVYARTKHMGETLALEAAAAGRDVLVANPGFLIGPDDVYRVSTWLVERYLRGTLRVYIEGGLSFVDARDVARGLLLLAEKGRPGERTILTCREGNLSLHDFLLRVREVTGVRRRMVKIPVALAVAGAALLRWPAKPGEVAASAHWWFFDPGKAERELGFTTRPLEEAIRATAEQYLPHGRRL
jgi:dihydroflavonol-4-reductase